MTTLPLVLLLALGAGGEIHRCVESGRVVFQDKPCAGSAAQGLKTHSDSAKAERELRIWLAQQRARAEPPSPSAGRSSESVTVSEARLAVCSERFLHCAGSDESAMDACVATLPRCGPNGGDCCPAACINRYQVLRADGHERASAVRLALLDPNAPACASP